MYIRTYVTRDDHISWVALTKLSIHMHVFSYIASYIAPVSVLTAIYMKSKFQKIYAASIHTPINNQVFNIFEAQLSIY